MRGGFAFAVCQAIGLTIALGASTAWTQTQTPESKSEPEASSDAPKTGVAEGSQEGLAGLARLGTMVPQTPITILLAPPVQAELNLTDKQKSKAFDLALASSQKQRDLYRSLATSPDANAGDLISARTGLRQENEQAVARILEPKQAQRLNQIVLQFEGPLAVSRPEIASKLRLNDSQNQQIQSIMLELQQRQRMMYAAARRQAVTLSQLDPSRFGEVRKSMARVRDAAVQEVAKVLDRKQKLAFNKMLGEPFDIAKLDPEASPGAKASNDPSKSKAEAKASSSSSSADSDEPKASSRSTRRRPRSKSSG